MVAFLLLETLMIGVFCALDLVLFYIFFEGGLIPMFLIVGIWGGKERIYAAFKFFLYTFLGSVLMLVAMIAMYIGRGHHRHPDAADPSVQAEPVQVLGFTVLGGAQMLMWIAFFASFAVKMPMWPVHTWLPDAHVQAPTAGSVVLAAILLKMGGYGFLRFSIPMFPVASDMAQDFVFLLSVDRHRLHQPRRADAGGHEEADRLFVGGAHGLRDHGHLRGEPAGHGRRDLPDAEPRLHLGRALPHRRRDLRPDAHARDRGLRRLVVRMPVFALVFMLFTMGNVGLPGTSGFVGEFLTLSGAFQATPGWRSGRRPA
jgi:NADH-quinone oxidoreductase subunit M